MCEIVTAVSFFSVTISALMSCGDNIILSLSSNLRLFLDKHGVFVSPSSEDPNFLGSTAYYLLFCLKFVSNAVGRKGTEVLLLRLLKLKANRSPRE